MIAAGGRELGKANCRTPAEAGQHQQGQQAHAITNGANPSLGCGLMRVG